MKVRPGPEKVNENIIHFAIRIVMIVEVHF